LRPEGVLFVVRVAYLAVSTRPAGEYGRTIMQLARYGTDRGW
jgi:hypothetical protein